MAKVILNPVFIEIRGKLGNSVLRGSQTGKTFVIRLADMSNVQWSEAQKAHRQRFREATAYAKAAMAEPKVRARYQKQAAKVKKTPFSLAVSDYFKDISLLEK